MPVPKKKRSKTKKRIKRACFKVATPHLVPCGHCASPILMHNACPDCGYYNGKQVLSIKVKDKQNEDA